MAYGTLIILCNEESSGNLNQEEMGSFGLDKYGIQNKIIDAHAVLQSNWGKRTDDKKT